ncbi:hypothetical protein A3860_34645 [Niastella vici]|uniref:Uncharacterized protein n=1 Tax=Niastella vici TaxID=1703345 RepID=A0A1V9FP05_9BACT|nr:hypothetical protein [Niastella vici]OQP60072.1 hypothetical protein A3860_34645 [Niastella vici]
MKKLMVYLIVFTMTASLSCENEQEISASSVPEPVMNAFKAKYPAITPDKWVKEKEKGKVIYEAKFTRDNKKGEAEFDESGNFIEED